MVGQRKLEAVYTHRRDFRSRQTQHTLGIGAVVYF